MEHEPHPSGRENISDEEWQQAKTRLGFYFTHHGGSNPDDLTQETLTRLLAWLRDGNRIRGEDGFQKLCYGFARNVLLESIGRRGRHMDQLDPNMADTGNKTLGLGSRDTAVFVREMLDLLSAPDREIILAAELLEPPGMARKFKTSVANVTLRLCRARKRLRKAVESAIDSGGPA